MTGSARPGTGGRGGDYRSRAMRRLIPLAWIAGGAAALWLAFGHGFANYDTFYALVWGNEIFGGAEPDYGAPIPPTPHPLATAVGVVLAPFGDGAEPITVAIAFLSLAALAYLTYRLGERWFGWPAGLLAAAIVITREPVLSNGVRAYVDIPYIALVLAALVVETKRPRAGWPVLALLALAGLLRPEAWLFSAAYLVYLAYTRFRPSALEALGAAHRSKAASPRLSRRLAATGSTGSCSRSSTRSSSLQFLRLAALAAAAPVLWLLYDLAFAGDPLYSLTGTRDTVETLGRDTGLWRLDPLLPPPARRDPARAGPARRRGRLRS